LRCRRRRGAEERQAGVETAALLITGGKYLDKPQKTTQFTLLCQPGSVRKKCTPAYETDNRPISKEEQAMATDKKTTGKMRLRTEAHAKAQGPALQIIPPNRRRARKGKAKNASLGEKSKAPFYLYKTARKTRESC